MLNSSEFGYIQLFSPQTSEEEGAFKKLGPAMFSLFKAIEFNRNNGDSSKEVKQLCVMVATLNIRLVYKCLKMMKFYFKESFYSSDATLKKDRAVQGKDLVHEGFEGLIKAAEKFDWRRGYNFSTYAWWWAQQYLIRAIYNSGTIRLAVHMCESVVKLRKAEEALRRTLKRKPNEAELLEYLRWSLEKFDAVSSAARLGEKFYSLDELLDDGKTTLLNLNLKQIDFHSKSNGADDFERNIFISQLKPKIDDILSVAKISPKEREMLWKHFAFGQQEDETLEKIGKSSGITRERVRQIVEREIFKLRSPRYIDRFKSLLPDEFNQRSVVLLMRPEFERFFCPKVRRRVKRILAKQENKKLIQSLPQCARYCLKAFFGVEKNRFASLHQINSKLRKKTNQKSSSWSLAKVAQTIQKGLEKLPATDIEQITAILNEAVEKNV